MCRNWYIGSFCGLSPYANAVAVLANPNVVVAVVRTLLVLFWASCT